MEVECHEMKIHNLRTYTSNFYIHTYILSTIFELMHLDTFDHRTTVSLSGRISFILSKNSNPKVEVKQTDRTMSRSVYLSVSWSLLPPVGVLWGNSSDSSQL